MAEDAARSTARARPRGADRRHRQRGDGGRPRGARRRGACRSRSSAPTRAIRARPSTTADLDDLTASIREKGVVQPILVRPVAGAADAYEIIAGERRWRAAQKAGLHDVPVVVHEVADKEALELAIIENVQRADLNRARGGARLPAAHRRVRLHARASSPT